MSVPLKIQKLVLYFEVIPYPDITIVKGQEILLDDSNIDTLVNPFLIIEVLSATTAQYDRTGKFETYKQIESLQEYVLVAQSSPHIAIYSRKNRAEWLYREEQDTNMTIELSLTQVLMPLQEVYAHIHFR
jgi:Uma2 family endonuclease